MLSLPYCATVFDHNRTLSSRPQQETLSLSLSLSSYPTRNSLSNIPTGVKKRLPKKIREIPDYYFLPRKSRPAAMLFYGSWIVAGIGAGMLTEVGINKKVKEDGGVIWEFD